VTRPYPEIRTYTGLSYACSVQQVTIVLSQRRTFHLYLYAPSSALRSSELLAAATLDLGLPPPLPQRWQPINCCPRFFFCAVVFVGLKILTLHNRILRDGGVALFVYFYTLQSSKYGHTKRCPSSFGVISPDSHKPQHCSPALFKFGCLHALSLYSICFSIQSLRDLAMGDLAGVVSWMGFRPPHTNTSVVW
jgi:hypothetical protein